ncbi:hypothetical protein D3C75_780380 [compost metagenome]
MISLIGIPVIGVVADAVFALWQLGMRFLGEGEELVIRPVLYRQGHSCGFQLRLIVHVAVAVIAERYAVELAVDLGFLQHPAVDHIAKLHVRQILQHPSGCILLYIGRVHLQHIRKRFGGSESR